METAQVSITIWADKKLWYIYAMEYYMVIKRRKSYFCDSMDGPEDYYAK